MRPSCPLNATRLSLDITHVRVSLTLLLGGRDDSQRHGQRPVHEESLGYALVVKYVLRLLTQRPQRPPTRSPYYHWLTFCKLGAAGCPRGEMPKTWAQVKTARVQSIILALERPWAPPLRGGGDSRLLPDSRKVGASHLPHGDDVKGTPQDAPCSGLPPRRLRMMHPL